MKIIDDFLNKITMYRLVLYYLIVLLGVAVIFSFFHVIAYNPVYIILSSLFLVFFSGYVNDFFADIFEAPVNTESAYITALILALIITPAKSLSDFIFLGWAAVLSMSAKYIFAIGKKHIFNPVAISVVLTAIFINQSASWWVGNFSLLPFVLLGGLLIVRKTRKEEMVFCFLLTASLTLVGFSIIRGSNIITSLGNMFLHSSLLFFTFVMFTEPLTMPGTTYYQMIFSYIVGFLFVPYVHLGSLYSTPELALIIGNIFAYVVSPKEKLILHLKDKIKLSADTYDFVFPLDQKISFVPGQYMEWTLAHDNVDDRGNRRYFTLASSPTEDNIRLGIKFYDKSSSYKKKMLFMDQNTKIVAASRAGDFTLPLDKNKKLVFLAGGIGVTPFRSMIKYLIDKNEYRDIVLIFSNKLQSEIVYKDIFDVAQNQLKIKIIYTLTDIANIPSDWTGEKGRINEEMIKRQIPDYMTRHFYLSGPHNMVSAFESVLKSSGVNPENIKTDFFPGFV